MSKLPLLGQSPLLEPYRGPLLSEDEPPRALKTLARIVDEDLCHRCGSCVGICPTNVLGRDENDFPIVENLGACTDCDLCVKVCPGDEFEVASVAAEQFGYVPDLGDMHGHFNSAYLSFASDSALRKDSTSGGLITGLLLHLLEANVIDGAIVVASDEHDKWKGKPIVARSREELLASTKSKYAIAPTNAVFKEIRAMPGRYALVGLPCQIHGFHKAAALDKRIKERVVVTIGLFCHAAVEHEPMQEIWNTIVRDEPRTGKVTRFISRVGKHPGTPHVELEDGTLRPVYFPEARGYRPSSMEIINILYRLYTPPRCLTCYDSTSEFADIAVGDPWMAPPADDIDFYEGYSFTLARTGVGEQMLKAASDAGAIVLRKLEPKAARTSNTMMGIEKRWRAFRIIETRRRQGKAVPEYHFETPKASGKHLLLTELNMLSHVFCFVKRGRLSVLRFAFSRWGYALLWLNHKKRIFRNWRRDTAARVSRRVTGAEHVYAAEQSNEPALRERNG
ncbi:MAG: Coenzyme F420 hydrogenase/dehydrogenase, beta subunit C-terminal domain [Bdellovibrionales bacterium]|nr:Coenzyme F420 hydrogenase/dehydrogenase, beta subunit C-terminal domain [Bdellovibrionales bacterium]